MPSESSSATAQSTIYAPGGSIHENSPGVIVFIVIAIIAVVWLWSRRKDK